MENVYFFSLEITFTEFIQTMIFPEKKITSQKKSYNTDSSKKLNRMHYSLQQLFIPNLIPQTLPTIPISVAIVSTTAEAARDNKGRHSGIPLQFLSAYHGIFFSQLQDRKELSSRFTSSAESVILLKIFEITARTQSRRRAASSPRDNGHLGQDISRRDTSCGRGPSGQSQPRWFRARH